MLYFDLFEIPVAIKFDRTILSKKYFELQKKFHPDFYTLATEVEQQEVLEKSSQVNKALKVLKNEDATLEYILTEKGILLPDEKFQLPPDFLMEVMELNEDFDATTPEKIKAFEEAIFEDVEPIINNYNNELITPTDLQQLKTYHFKKKYLQRILERIED
ncbi:MAG: Fe-S protein assembly co-chaperone HscB [Ferruginibacter sp.]|nr:Fe-S protein assembly co-chaperone HscB [Ferruginibacter sp.]